ncbi:hypothetical protein LAZ67_2003657 [Cordylochernes scorpioides]|uniref:Uncharacterized protein n=1 Tax=Cordylochernes scorpioides TaxID=51811 RepID=A0ABY6K4Q3_9ARAC|nr:hypothetical protein LAZ67_2003657 [Cordylochernes scorpioides]
MLRVAARFSPICLKIQQREARLSIYENILESYWNNPDIRKQIIPGDDTWVYAYDPDTKLQPKRSKYQNFVYNFFFFLYFEDLVQIKFLVEGSAKIQYVYLDILCRLREGVDSIDFIYGRKKLDPVKR